MLLDGGTRTGRGYMGFVSMVPHLTQGDTQITAVVQPRDDRGRVGRGSVQSFRSVLSSMLRWLQGRPGTVAVW